MYNITRLTRGARPALADFQRTSHAYTRANEPTVHAGVAVQCHSGRSDQRTPARRWSYTRIIQPGVATNPRCYCEIEPKFRPHPLSLTRPANNQLIYLLPPRQGNRSRTVGEGRNNVPNWFARCDFHLEFHLVFSVSDIPTIRLP